MAPGHYFGNEIELSGASRVNLTSSGDPLISYWVPQMGHYFILSSDFFFFFFFPHWWFFFIILNMDWTNIFVIIPFKRILFSYLVLWFTIERLQN